MEPQPQSPGRPESPNYQQPVAYDVDGRPLYVAPQPAAPIQNVVHISRAVSPVEPEVSPEVRKKHQASIRQYPELNLSEHEYVISAVRRHPIGMVIPVVFTALVISLVLMLVINYPAMMSNINVIDPPPYGIVLMIGMLLTILFLIGGYMAVLVYVSNKFFLTNESVVQEIQTSLFSHRQQTVSLLNIEDASYSQRGIIQNIFNYGSIRLSTEGEETTYRFDYVASPRDEIAVLNNAVEAFKNGRPVN